MMYWETSKTRSYQVVNFANKGTKGCVFSVNVFELNLFLNNRVNAVEKSGLKLQFIKF